MKDIPERPEPTMPCTGCGECCREKVCKWGLSAFPDAKPPCPGLLWENGRYWCLLVKVEASEPVEKLMTKSLGIGRGCFKNINPKLYRTDNMKDILKLWTHMYELATEQK